MKHIDLASFSRVAASMRRPYHDQYYAMYSSIYGGVVTDPALMMVPLDDHMVHRGDGIFEVFKCIDGSIYNLAAHLERLDSSTRRLGYRMPATMREIRRITIETIRMAGHRDCYVHLYVSRGPGSFGVNPYDCPQTQLYVVVTSFKQPFMELTPAGARVRISTILAKPGFYAGVKSCNYMPNVLMKKQCDEWGVDFVVCFDEYGRLAEGATENMGIVTPARELLFPKLEGILRGTTMMRALTLARGLITAGALKRVAFEDISRDDIDEARELLIVGTTPNVTAVREFEGRPVGNGKPGPVYRKLGKLLLDDMYRNQRLRTPVFAAAAS